MTQEKFESPRGLARKWAIANVLTRLSLTACFSLLLAYPFFSERPTRMKVLLLCLAFTVSSWLLDDLRIKLRNKVWDAYEDEPTGLFFTGSLYRVSEYNVLFRMPRGRHNICSCLSRNPYPDGAHVGGNGVLKEATGRAWVVLLVSVNGMVNVTCVRPAEYGWQHFVVEKLR